MDIVQRIIRTYGTNNPLIIATLLGVEIIYEELGSNIWGYYVKLSRIPQIHINHRLEETVVPFAIGHELGHHFLHPHVNTPFLRRNTLFSVEKIEKEAHSFAVHLMVGNAVPEIGMTTEHFLTQCDIPLIFHGFY